MFDTALIDLVTTNQLIIYADATNYVEHWIWEEKKRSKKNTKHLLLIFFFNGTALHTFRVACGALSVSNQYHFHRYHFRREKEHNSVENQKQKPTLNWLFWFKIKNNFFLLCRRRFCFALDVCVWNTWKSTQAMIYTEKLIKLCMNEI